MLSSNDCEVTGEMMLTLRILMVDRTFPGELRHGGHLVAARRRRPPSTPLRGSAVQQRDFGLVSLLPGPVGVVPPVTTVIG